MMPIVCTGASKSGTHLLLKAVRLFYGNIGLPFHSHVPHAHKESDKKYINIIRNPRNTLISWVRFNRLPIDEKHLIQEIPDIIAEGAEYLGWLADDDALNVRFEELNTTPSELDKIAEFIDMPLVDKHYSKLWGGTKTFTGKLSHWPPFWTPEVAKCWTEHGGDNLERQLGYGDNT